MPEDNGEVWIEAGDLTGTINAFSQAYRRLSFTVPPETVANLTEGHSDPREDPVNALNLVETGRGRWSCHCQACDRAIRTGNTNAIWREHTDEADRKRQEFLDSEEHDCALDGCGQRRQRRDMHFYRSDYYCSEHMEVCGYCSSRRVSSTMRQITRPSGAVVHYCTNCAHRCTDCQAWFSYEDMRSTATGYICIPHSFECDECGTYSSNRNGEQCYECEHNVQGLTGYGKTTAQHWLGGPVPKGIDGIDRGYYLGFELEVTAFKGHVRPLHDWAEENLGFRDAIDCKTDSSVTGFEIATQPMTPEFFEQVDWEGFFQVLNKKFPLGNRKRTEPTGHGLHVHIGRTAFAKDDIAMAAFCYLIGQSNHLERIARRKPTNYCNKVTKPVSSVIRNVSQNTGKFQQQAMKAQRNGVYLDRNAINLLNSKTIEIRAFRSTRKAQDLKDAVRLVYVAAEYIRYLRFTNVGVPPKALHWTSFVRWVGANHPEAFESISGMKAKNPVR